MSDNTTQVDHPENEESGKRYSISGLFFGNAAAEPSDEDIVYFKKLGLGRGLNVAKPSPWLNKSSFQVRDFTKDDIMETLEGGSLQHYDREITSDHQQRSEIRGTVKPTNAPVAIGVDAEQSRSYSYSRHAVGTKIINRTISFRVSFEDAPRSKVEGSPQSKHTTPNPESQPPQTTPAKESFEEKFSRWLLERIMLYKPSESSKWVELKLSNTEKVADFINKNHQEVLEKDKRGKDKNILQKVQEDCSDFVTHFGVTHYVSAIELGASAYQVMSEKEFSARVAGKGSMGVESIVGAAASISISQEFQWRRKKKSIEQKKIGKITTTEEKEKLVKKDPESEAVVGIQILPISSLVRNYYLERALRAALIDYTTREERLAGPFLIACGPAAQCPTTTTHVSQTATPIAGSTAAAPTPIATAPGSTTDTPAPTPMTPGSTADTPAPTATTPADTLPPTVTTPGSTADTPAPTATTPADTLPPTVTTPGSTADNPAPTATTPADTLPPTVTTPGSTADPPAPTATTPANTRRASAAATPETKTLYLHVKPEHKLLGVTKNECEATKFSIVPIEGSHPHEFMIMSTSQQMLSASQEKIPYYLEAKCNINGTQSRDLKMRTSIKVRNARMALQKSVVEEDHKVPIDITRWLQGKESYFIRCARRIHSKGGYLCVKKPAPLPSWHPWRKSQSIDNYEVKILPSINMHDDDKNNFMLFRLLPQGLIPGLSEGHQHVRTDGESDLLQMS